MLMKEKKFLFSKFKRFKVFSVVGWEKDLYGTYWTKAPDLQKYIFDI